MTETISDLLRQANRTLTDAGVEDSDFSAKAILAFILNKKIIDLHLEQTEPVGEHARDRFFELIDKRAGFYPLQYILGTVEFYNTSLIVNEDVLIPRPETEVLVDKTLELIKKHDFKTVMDIGTGCGNIAIALACADISLEVTGVDVSEAALAVAGTNAHNNNAADRVGLRQADCLGDEFWSERDKYDVIISNPPYIGPEEYKSLQQEITDFEPKAALTPGADSLLFYRTISSRAQNRLNRPGLIAFEVGCGQADRVCELIKKNNLSVEIAVIKDYSGIDRVVFGYLPG